MANRDDIPKTDPSEIEALIQRLKQSTLEPRDAQLVGSWKKAACGFFRVEGRAGRLIKSFFNILGSSFKTRPTSEGG